MELPFEHAASLLPGMISNELNRLNESHVISKEREQKHPYHFEIRGTVRLIRQTPMPTLYPMVQS